MGRGSTSKTPEGGRRKARAPGWWACVSVHCWSAGSWRSARLLREGHRSGSRFRSPKIYYTRRMFQVSDAVSYRFLADSLPQILWIASPDGDVTFVNRYWTEYSGVQPAQTL